MLNKCPSRHCRKCNSKHHTLLHIELTPQSQPSSDPDFVGLNNASSAVLVSSTELSDKPVFKSSNILFATAIVLMKNQCGSYVPCHAILDSDSQLNLITSNLVENQQLKCSKASSTICGIGDGSIKVNRSVDVDIKSRHSGFSATSNAMVVPSITNYYYYYYYL